MTVATQLEILDLRHFSARQLRPLLEREAAVWKERLRWDYEGSTELLLQYLDQRALPGFVALDRGRLRGFAFCVYEGNKAVIGDAYTMGEAPGESFEITKTLLQHLIRLARHSPGVARVEAQLLLYDAGVIDDIFIAHGFEKFPRRFLELELTRPAKVEGWAVPREIELAPWAAEDYQRAAELIHLAYAGHVDSKINDQYRTLHGSLRFLHNIVRFPGCGVFDPASSWVLRDVRDGALVGMILCSDVGDRVAHITQICVAPAYRGRALARQLMQHAIAHLRRTGHQAITLTVTDANVEAMRLYAKLGFATRHGFNAMMLETGR